MVTGEPTAPVRTPWRRCTPPPGAARSGWSTAGCGRATPSRCWPRRRPRSPRRYRRSGWPAARSPCCTSRHRGPTRRATPTRPAASSASSAPAGSCSASQFAAFDGAAGGRRHPRRPVSPIWSPTVPSSPEPVAVAGGVDGAAAAHLGLDRDAQGGADLARQRVEQPERDAPPGRPRAGRSRDGVLAAAVPRHGHGRIPDAADGVRHRDRQGHPGRLPAHRRCSGSS